MKQIVILALCCALSTASAQEAPDTTRVYTEEHPLIYEDAWDLWPYVFLNENGEPVGYNIDLLKIIFSELNIPYVIKLKPTSEALKDLKSGQSDLMLGMDAYFHDDYAIYGKSVIQLFTHSVLHQKGEDPKIQSVADLANHKVIVHGGSFSYHLMVQNGWENNAIPYDDMQEAVQKAHLDPNSQIVWNTLSLKWLINKFQMKNLELTAVDIQHGEYKFMSNNPKLLQRLDSIYSVLRSEDRLQPIQNKWFYPERQETSIPAWVWYVSVALVLAIICLIIYYTVFRIREKKMTKAIQKSNNRLAQILNTSKVRIWIFHVANRTVTTLDQNGQVMATHPSIDFFRQTTPNDFERLSEALNSIVKGEKEKDTFNITGKDETGDKELRNFTVSLSILRRDKNGHPSDIIGTRSDITKEKLKQQQVKDMMLRYKVIFNSAMTDMVTYDENGIITDMNDKAWNAFTQSREEILSKKISISDVLGMDVDLDTMETIYVTQIFKSLDDERALNKYLQREKMYYELKLIPIRDNNGKLIAIYGSGRDVTEVALSYSNLQKNLLLLQEANNEMSKYMNNIDYVLQNGNVRMVTYSPDTHTMNIYSELNRIQYKLTQTRAIELTDEESKKTAQRLLNNMDNLAETSIDTDIKTVLRVHGLRLHLQMSFIPVYDKDRKVISYFGMCRDVSKIKATEAELERETVKAQEIETVKNAFLHNMSYEIRTPLNTVVGFAELFEMDHSAEDEAIFINEIKQSSSKLLKLINDILFLSRLDAHMIEFKPKESDFSAFFETRCQTGWFNFQKPGVTYSVDNPYEHFIVEVDEQNLGIVIDQIVVNAAQNTTSGQVRARYDYTGDNLVMAFQDSGSGIPEDKLVTIFDRFMTTDGHGTGLGLSICNEIIKQMNGKINIKSTVGKGTIVWVTIPCKFIDIERK